MAIRFALLNLIHTNLAKSIMRTPLNQIDGVSSLLNYNLHHDQIVLGRGMENGGS